MSGLPAWIFEHLERYQATDGEDGHDYDFRFNGGYENTPTLLLTTTGRRSGKPITLPLIYGRDGDRVILIASKGGAPNHPAWYLNMQANPEVQLQIRADKFAATMSVAEGQDREKLWKMMVEIYPPFEEYQQNTSRQIPVAVLSPV